MRLSSKLLLITAFCMAVSPWVVYSKRHYNTPWASDNSAVAVNANEMFVQDYKRSAETVFTNPRKWAGRIGRNGVSLLRAADSASAEFHPLSPLLLAAAWTLWWLAGWPGPRFNPLQKRLLLFVGAAFVGLGGQLLTGYMDSRYFSLVCALATCWLVCAVLSHPSAIRVAATLWIVIVLLQSPKALLRTARESRNISLSLETLVRHAEMEAPPPGPRAVVLAGSHLCYEYGALTRQPTVCLPSDWDRLTPAEKEEFLSSFHVTHSLFPASQVGPPSQTSAAAIRLQILPIQAGLERLTF
jgi:hypothetical protein